MTELPKGYAYFAQKDADVIADLVESGIGHHAEAIAYHCQQLAEKVLKEAFVSRGVEPAWTHDLWRLMMALQEDGLIRVDSSLKPCADRLTICETAGRYASTLDIGRGEAMEAMADCRAIALALEEAGFYVPSISWPRGR